MKTTKWQTKALMLFIAALALWLAAACGNDVPTIEGQPTPAATAPTASLEPTSKSCKENTMTLTPTQKETFTNKHFDMLAKQPNQMGFGYGKLWNVENGEVVELKNEDGTNQYGLNIHVSEKVDQSTLPESVRIPDCLDDVPVNWIEHDKWLMPWEVPSEWFPEQGFAEGGK